MKNKDRNYSNITNIISTCISTVTNFNVKRQTKKWYIRRETIQTCTSKENKNKRGFDKIREYLFRNIWKTNGTEHTIYI